MVSDKQQHYRWDFIGLSSDTKPTPVTTENVVDGSTFYCSDTSKLYVFYKGTWYENTRSGGGGGGGSSDVSVKEIDYSNPDEWDSEEDQPTAEVIDDILANKYTIIHVYNILLGTGVSAETYLVTTGMVDVNGTGIARYYYKFDEGDEDEGTTPNIEQYLFIHQEGESAQMITETFELGEKNNVAVYSADFDMSQGYPTLSQNDMANIFSNKPDIIRLTAGTTTTIGNKSREDTETAQVIYSSTVMEGTTPTVYIITITYDAPNSQYVFNMGTYQLSASA